MGGCIEGPRLGSEADRSVPLSDSLLVNRGPPLPPALGGCEALPFAAAAPPAAAAACTVCVRLHFISFICSPHYAAQLTQGNQVAAAAATAAT